MAQHASAEIALSPKLREDRFPFQGVQPMLPTHYFLERFLHYFLGFCA